MKHIFIMIGFLLGIEAYSQEAKIIYYDLDWKELSDKNNASFLEKLLLYLMKKGTI